MVHDYWLNWVNNALLLLLQRSCPYASQQSSHRLPRSFDFSSWDLKAASANFTPFLRRLGVSIKRLSVASLLKAWCMRLRWRPSIRMLRGETVSLYWPEASAEQIKKTDMNFLLVSFHSKAAHSSSPCGPLLIEMKRWGCSLFSENWRCTCLPSDPQLWERMSAEGIWV